MRDRAREPGTLSQHRRHSLELLLLAALPLACGDGAQHGPDGGGPGVSDAGRGPGVDAPAGPEPGMPPGPPPLPSRETACDNDLDDDSDTFIDCADNDCSAEAACASAPPLDRTIAAGFHETVRFLFDGEQAVQLEVDPDAFDPMRISVLRGRVIDRQGKAVDGVRITVHGQDAYGYTTTRQGGTFDVVLNGGGPATLSYHASGFLPVQRTIDTDHRQYHWLPDVVLTARDAVVTEIVPGAAEVQVARGSVQEDEDGARQATMVFPAGTQATAVLPDGSEVALDTMRVRATEYTTGERGREAMPGTLPPTSGYTYAVELSVDEADAMGASSVVFDQPVGLYLENFLGFEVGESVPTGYYDRERAAWVPSKSGVVLAIVDELDGLATIDLDGDDIAEDDETLAAAGITVEERAELALLYEPGQTLWRAPITHFTPWDCNWPFGPPFDAIFPDDDFFRDPDHERPCTRAGSVIQCERQSLGQLVGVPGTHVTLAYHGHRKRGWQADHELAFQLSGTNLPTSAKGVVLEVEIAGQRHEQRFDAAANLQGSFSWDGRDAYGRRLQGMQRARVRLGYTYDGVYGSAPRFGGRGRGQVTGVRSRSEVTLWREAMVPVGIWDAQPQGLGGFGLASHHAYDPESKTLFLGDGTQRSARNVAPVLVELIKNVTANEYDALHAVHGAADGSVYAATLYGRIYRIAPDGSRTLVAAGLREPRDLALAADGTLYVAENNGNRIIAIAPDGSQTVVAGGGTDYFLDLTGAAIPATQVKLQAPAGIALAPDGGLYIADRILGTGVVRYVDPAGMLSNIDGLFRPFDVELGADGSLYVSHLEDRTLRRMHPDGRIEVVFDRSAGIAPLGLAVRADGSVFVSDLVTMSVIRVDPDGTRTTVAGGGQRDMAHGEISTDIGIPYLHRVAVDAEGELVFSARTHVYRVTAAVPGISADDIAVPSRDGRTLYVFDRTGRHRETRDALTGVTLLAFNYDDHGRVIAVTDRAGLSTHIERDPTGLAQAIVGPYAQRTALFYEDSGDLERIRDPLQREVMFGYDLAGRLTSMRDARGGQHRYDYDARGRLVTDIGPTGYTQTLAPAGDALHGSDVSVTTSRARSMRYELQRTSSDEVVRTTHLPWGGRGIVRKRAGRTEATAPDGTTSEFTLASDPRWQSQAPWARTARVRTPQGRTFEATSERELAFDDPAHPHRVTSLEQRHTINGRTSTARYDAAARTITSQTPGGQQRTVTLDELGRVLRIDQAGKPPYLVEYDDDGRIELVQHGEGAATRITRFHYDENGNLAERIDPLQRTHIYEHDVLGRLRALEGPDGTRIELEYDAHDNLAKVVPPGRPAHQFRYTGADSAERYIPPALAGVDAEVGFRYDTDLAPESADGPGDQQIMFHHDQAGRIERVSLARGEYLHEYDPTTGELARLSSPDAVGLHYGRDGPLLRETRWSILGAAEAVVSYDQDDAFRLWKLGIQGTAPIVHGYDANDALTQAGPLTIQRDPQTSLPDITRAGAVETDLDLSQFGEPERYAATFAGQLLYEASYERDALGRITHLDEIIAGQPRSVTYDYDDADRLAYVEEQGQPARELLYDSNGNLVEVREADIPVLVASHDAQDRLQTHGHLALTYTDSGHLETKLDTHTGERTTYRYDEFGNLLGAELADGRSIQYLVDGADRRVAKLMDGELQWLFVYAGGLPVARLHPDGSVESIYVYGALAHVPDVVIKGGRTYRIVHDQLGSPRLVVDVETGDMAQRLDYDVSGRVLADTNPDFQPFGFAGGLHDVDTGLVRFGARDYDPELGRWTAKDPSGFAGGDTNLYAYAYGDPVNFVDPNGELAFLVPLAIIAIKGALAGAAMDASIELASQLIENGGDTDCLDWGDVGTSAVGGASSGAVGGVFGKAFTAAKSLGKAAKGGRRAGKQFRPHPKAEGPHTVFRRDPETGRVSHYETYDSPSPGVGKRFDGVGPSHGGVDTPHVHPTTYHSNPADPTRGRFVEGPARPATPDELPLGYPQ
jgi:RHS repeat-associated protein